MNQTMFDVINAMNAMTSAMKELTKAVTDKELSTFEELFNPDTDLPAEAAQSEKAEEPKKEAAPKKSKYSKLDVRSCLSKLNKDGHTAEVQALLKKHGAAKLSEIDESEYEAIMEEAQSIGS